MSFLMYVLVVFVFVLPSSQDHSVRGGRWSERAGHEQVARRLHHGRLPAEEGRAAAHPGGPARGGRLPQRKPFLRGFFIRSYDLRPELNKDKQWVTTVQVQFSDLLEISCKCDGKAVKVIRRPDLAVKHISPFMDRSLHVCFSQIIPL